MCNGRQFTGGKAAEGGDLAPPLLCAWLTGEGENRSFLIGSDCYNALHIKVVSLFPRTNSQLN
jgi:hypothetical protein